MIVFDLQALQSPAHADRGIARYVADLARTLAADHPDAVDVFAWNDALPRSPRFDELGLGTRLQSFSSLAGRHVSILHVNSVFEPMFHGEFRVPVRADRLVATCYDMIPYRFLDQYLADPDRAAAYRTRLGMLAGADAVVTDSRSAADDVRDLVGVPVSRLTVIGAGVSERFVPPETSLEQRLTDLDERFPGLRPRYVFVPTGMDWRKNVPGAIAAFGRLPEDVRRRHQLVLSCSVNDDQRRWLRALADEAGLDDEILVTGYVSDPDLVLLYQSAELVMFPSFYEGFGLPVLEARRCGARVICSNASSLPEVLPDEAARFDPHDVDDMSDLLHRSLTDSRFAARLDRVPDSGFSWRESASRLVKVYGRLAARPTSAQPGRRRLALVTLMPPTPSGVADHSARLAAAIANDVDDVDLTVFVTGASAVTPTASYEVAELAALPIRWQRGEFDRVLYCFGNNPWHRDAYQMLGIVPGTVLLHDIRLEGMFDEWFRHRFRVDLYGEPDVPGDPDEPAGDRHEVLYARPVVRHADSVLVHSEHAADLLAADSDRSAIDVGPLPSRVVDDPSPDSGDGGAPWVLAVGIASETKHSGVFVEAARHLHQMRPARVALVGANGDRFVAPDDEIVVTGHVDVDEFSRWLDRASLIVQLRKRSNGESSGVVADALAHGVPMIVSDLGAMAELPDEIAVKVPPDVDARALAAAIDELLGDEERLAAMSAAGRTFAQRQTPTAQARRIVAALFD